MSDVVVAAEVSKNFGPVEAVKSLSMQVQRGEVYGLVGPNGAGKTTLVRMICGLLTPSAGHLTVLKKDVTRDARETSGRIGYMPQKPAVYEDLTVAENLFFFGRIYGMNLHRLQERVSELLGLTDLDERRESRVDTLSGGMKQRLSLAVSLLHEPELLLLDEPTAGVDPSLRSLLWRHFYDLNKDGATLLVTTHYMDEVERCKKVGLMHRGRLVAEGTPRELRAAVDIGEGASMEDVFSAIVSTGVS